MAEPDYKGEFLIIGDGGTGNCKFYCGSFSASDHNYLLRSRSKTNAHCVQYFLKRNNFKILNEGFKGVGIKNVSKTYIENIDYIYNHKFTENEIVSNLKRIEQVIENGQKQLVLLDELVKSRFIEMFGTFPNNEKEWDVTTIRKLATDVKYGTSIKAANGMSGKYKYIRMNNMTDDGELDFNDLKTIDVPESDVPKCSVKKGDLLFNRTNSAEKVGKTAVYENDELMILAGFIIRVRLKNNVLPQFLSSFLNANFSKLMLRKLAKQAVNQANINAQEMQNIEVYLPPLNLQQEYVSFKKQVDKSKFVVHSRYFLCDILTLFSSTIA